MDAWSMGRFALGVDTEGARPAPPGVTAKGGLAAGLGTIEDAAIAAATVAEDATMQGPEQATTHGSAPRSDA